MSEPVRFAVIGAGAIARAYESAFAQFDRARIVAVCDVVPEAAAELAARIGCPSFTSVETLVAHGAFDAAVICTPPISHEAIASLVLESGRHVLCEKPLSTSIESARRMLDCAERCGAILTMASKFRYVTDVRRARDLVLEGVLGDLVLVENAFTSYVDMRERWNSNAAISGGGVLIDNGTHAVDLLRYFLGNLRDVQIVEGRRMQGLAVEDTVRLFVRNDEGVIGSSDLSWSIDKELGTYIRLYGSDATILVGWKTSKLRRRGEREWHVFGNGYDKVQAFRSQIENFCDAIAGRAPLGVTPRDALASVEVIRAAYEALEMVRWQRVGSRIEEIEIEPFGTTKPLRAS